jgi:hypothetical protein
LLVATKGDEMLWVTIAVVVLLAVGWKYVVGPIVIHATSFQSATPRLLPVSPEQFLANVPPEFMQAIFDLQQLGFELVDHVSAPAQTNNTSVIMSLYVNRDRREIATVAHIMGFADPAPTLTLDYVEFSTLFDDGFVLDTNNSTTPSVFARIPELAVHRIPHVRDAQSLLRIHRHLASREAHRRAVLPPQGREVDAACEHIAAVLARQAALGYFYLDAASDRYRPTWKGACLMTWRLLWPVSAIVEQRQRAEGHRLARSAGVG